MDKDFLEQLKIKAPSLYQIHLFIVDTARLGFGVISFDIKSHDYVSKIVEMRAVKPNRKDLPKSITKRVMVKDEEKKMV